MVSQDEVEQQLKAINFNVHGWGRAEIKELPNIILPDEEIYEAVNGFYEGGFAMLLATNIRVLLVDKKPLNYLTVEDMRFDNISEMDYSHRVIGARVTVSAGDKHLSFASYNQARLRKLIGHTQHCMAKLKQDASEHQMGQQQHLEQINKQLQAYLVQQHKQQQKLYKQIQKLSKRNQKADADQDEPKLADFKPLEPSSELKDFLYAQGLLSQYQRQPSGPVLPKPKDDQADSPAPEPVVVQADPAGNQLADLYAAGMKEIFGRQAKSQSAQPANVAADQTGGLKPLDINPLKVAYSKLPLALRSKKFGLPFPKSELRPDPAKR